MQRKYKILINCYACSPYHGSEPGMGWHFIINLAKYHEIHVITEKIKWKKELSAYFDKHPEGKQNITFYFIAKKRNKVLRKIWPPSYYWYYKKWQKSAYELAVKLEIQHNFDIIHQLNMVGYREPGYLWKINKPFVWGPVGGMNISPWLMLPTMGFYGCIYYFFRNILNLYEMYLLKRVRQCARKSDAVIAATQDNYLSIKKLWNINSIIIPEVGLFSKEIPSFHSRSGKLKIAWVGQHIPRKSLNLLIDALSQTKSLAGVELNVVGSGQKTKTWKKRAEKRKINHLIKWYGWKKKNETEQIIRSCDLFCITSLSDLTSTVLLEALSFGLPVIALDHCGFSNVITDKCGIKIPIHTPKQVINAFAKAIDFVFENEELRISMAKAAYERAKDFNWEAKIEKLNCIYNDILN